MPKVVRDITVQKPVQSVWEYLADFRNSEKWDPPTLRTVRESGDGGIGTVYANTSKVLGRKTDITYTVVAYEPLHRIALRGETALMTLLDTVELGATNGRTTVHYVAEFEPHGAAKIAGPLLPIGLKKLGDDVADSLHAHLSTVPGEPRKE